MSTGDVRALRIGVLGASVAGVATALALFVLFILWGKAFEQTDVLAGDVEVVLYAVQCVLLLLALVVLPTTGYLAASGAPTRSGFVAVGAVSVVAPVVFAGTMTMLYGQLASFLGAIVLLTILAVGLTALGVAFGVRRRGRTGA